MEKSSTFSVAKSSQKFKKKKSKNRKTDNNSDDSEEDAILKEISRKTRSKSMLSKKYTNDDSADSDVSDLGDELNLSKSKRKGKSNVSVFNNSVKKMMNTSLSKSKGGNTLITELQQNNNNKPDVMSRVRTPVREWAENYLNGVDGDVKNSASHNEKVDIDIDKSENLDTGTDTDLEDAAEPEVIQRLSGAMAYIDECQRIGTVPVSYFTRHLEDREFVMKHHGLGPNGTKAMSTPLEWNTCIERLNLEGNDMQDNGAKHLCTMLKENLYISDLIIPENSLGSEGVDKIFRLLCDNNTINRLDLSGNEMQDRLGDGLAAMLDTNNSLRFLYLRNNHIGTMTAITIQNALGNNDSVELLDLAWNHIRGPGAVAISEGIAENCGIKYLNLSMNGFAEDGSVAMGKALIANRSLKELDLSWNRIPFEGAMGLAKGVMVNEDLKVLRVGNNPLTASGAYTILQAINVNENVGIEYLDLLEVFVSAKFLDLKFSLEEKLPKLEILHGNVTRDHMGAAHIVQYDFEAAFERDPMTILKRYAQANGLRLIDLFRQFDKDNSMTVSKEEFVLGAQSAGIEISDQQIDRLMKKLDRDGNGEIDYGELLEGDKKNKETQRLLLTVRDDNKRKQEEVEANPLLETSVVKKSIGDIDTYVNRDATDDTATSLTLNKY